MAIAASNSVTVSANGSSDWVKLSKGTNRPYNALIDDDLVPVNVTQNTSLDMNGISGYARITVANYGSSAVTFKVLNALDNRL